jgi:hypothetical protein
MTFGAQVANASEMSGWQWNLKQYYELSYGAHRKDEKRKHHFGEKIRREDTISEI